MQHAGAVTYVTKGEAPESLVDAIRKTANRKTASLEKESNGA
jgi:DNA-binding NarL/FixJ family response regulator